jgi:hypothetical protein
MASRRVTGTFSSAPTTSSEISCSYAIIDLTFAGTATVNLQWAVDGANFRTVETYTSSTQKVFESGVNVPIRLQCSAHTNNVTYAITTR